MKVGGILMPYGPRRGLVVQSYGDAVRSLKGKGHDIQAKLRNLGLSDQSAGVELDTEFISWLEDEADVILAMVPPDHEELLQRVKYLGLEKGKAIVPLTPDCAKLSTVAPEVLKMVWMYQSFGGAENIENLLLYLSETTGSMDVKQEIFPPKELPWYGIYHPRSERVFGTLDEYQSWYGWRSSPAIGIFFPRLFWIENSLEPIDALVEEIENRGFNVIPLFNDRWEGAKRDEEVIEEFFMKDGRTIVDVGIFYAAFFLSSTRKGTSIEPKETSLLKRLNIPSFQMIFSVQSLEEWQENEHGLGPAQSIISVTLPEFDGFIEPIIVAASEEERDAVTEAMVRRPKPIKKQVDYLITRAENWIKLRRKDNSRKRVAIILHNAPCKSGVEATVGAGFGLDTLESVARILQKLNGLGYEVDWVPRDGKELIDRIMERKAISEFRWTPLREIVARGGAADFVDLETYKAWLNEIPLDARVKVLRDWGDPFEGREKLDKVGALSLALWENKIVIPGLVLGNVFIGVQPKRGCAGARCDGEVCKILHDPSVAPPHQWLAFYRWIEKVFKADMIIHVGTHGSLELLPGKAVALSGSCFPQISLGNMPHLYIYVASNPMEGVIAKRRSYATLVDHLHPVMAAAELCGPSQELDDLIEDYKKVRQTGSSERVEALKGLILEASEKANFHSDYEDFDEFVESVHNQLNLTQETMFRDGLHILGQVPKDDSLVNLLVSVLRFDQGSVPSIRRGILELLGLNYEEVLKNTEGFEERFGRTNGKLLGMSTEVARNLMQRILKVVPVEEKAILDIVSEEVRKALDIKEDIISSAPEGAKRQLVNIVNFGLGLLPKIEKTTDEIDNLLRGLDGKFIEPGASGALTRGKVEILPTGRNFYAIDPWRIPTPAAWETGKNLSNLFLEKYLREHGSYPETIGIVFRFFDVFRADGELLSQILYTLGVRPLWDYGRVRRLELIPLEVLKRPRIDCIVHLSSILRDGMPRAFELIDEAVQMVSGADEPHEMNYVRKHAEQRKQELLYSGFDEPKAQRLATLRVFTARPGSYDYGVNTAIAASAWRTDEDLANVFTEFCGYAYGRGVYGQAAQQEFNKGLSLVSLTYDKWDSDEYDILDCCHIYGSHGGFTLAAKVISQREIKVYFGDTRDPDRPEIRDMKDELERVARTRLLNPKWIEGKRRHGYKGASDISCRVSHIYGWQATTRLVGDWVFDEIARTFVLGEKMRSWFKENNPWALEEMARRLLEAEQRGLWNANPEVLKELNQRYLEIEGWMEDLVGEGDFQGGAINIMTRDEILNARDKDFVAK